MVLISDRKKGLKITIVKIFSSIHVFLYRLSRGRIGSRMAGLKVLLLTTTGRKSGRQRTTTLGFLEEDGDYVVIASNGGSDQNPGWYYNLIANPRVTIQVHDKVMPVTAAVADAAERARLWQKLLQVAPGYQDYEKRTTREIPLVLLRP